MRICLWRKWMKNSLTGHWKVSILSETCKFIDNIKVGFLGPGEIILGKTINIPHILP